jgi:hypothetical protein
LPQNSRPLHRRDWPDGGNHRAPGVSKRTLAGPAGTDDRHRLASAFTPFSVYLLISFMKLTDFACLPPDSVTGNPSAGHGRAGFDPDSTGAAQ